MNELTRYTTQFPGGREGAHTGSVPTGEASVSGFHDPEHLSMALLKGAVLDRIREAVLLIAQNGHFLYANDAASRLLGFDATEILRMSEAHVAPDWTKEKWQEGWDRLRDSGSSRRETIYRCRNGNFLSTTAEWNYLESEGVGYGFAVVRNVREIQTNRSREWEIDDCRQHTLDGIPNALYILARTSEGQFRFVEINRAFETAFDVPREQLLGKLVEESIAVERWPTLCCQLSYCTRAGIVTEENLTIDVAGGPQRYHSTLVPLKSESGIVTRIMGIAHIVSPDGRPNFDSDSRFHRLAESTTDIISLYNSECRLVYGNSALTTALRRPLEDLLGRTPAEHSPEPQFERYQEAIATVINKGTNEEIELTLPESNGGVNHHHVRIVPERGLDGQIIGALSLGRDITERKKAEERTRASEQAFRAVVENSPDGIIRYDADFRRVYLNPVALAQLNCGQHKLIGSTPREYSALTDVERYMDQLDRVFRTGAEVRAEMRIRDGSGQFRWSHIRTIPEFGPNGEVTSLLAISRDVDELKKSEQLFRTLTENLPDFVTRLDSHCRYLYVNPAMSEVLGIESEEFIGKHLREMTLLGDAEQRARLETGIRRAFIDGRPNEDHAQWKTEKGWHIFQVRHIPEKDADGNVVSVLEIAHDITELRAIESALRDSERAFRTLAENAPDAIVRYDRDLQRIYVNPEFERVMAGSASKRFRRSSGHASYAPTDDVPWFKAKLRAILDNGAPAKFELVSPEDKDRCWYVSAVPEFDAQGSIQSVLATWRDISERKRAEHRLRQSYEMLRELASRRETAREEERKRIAREVHDELAQCLTALRMGASMLRLTCGHLRADLDIQAQDLLVLTDRALAVVRDVVSLLRPAALDAGIVAALEWLAADFCRRGNTPCRINVKNDNLAIDDQRATALFRIVQEALTNVTRHANANEVSISLHQVRDAYVLEIRDDGAGFDMAKIKRNSFGLAGIGERVRMLGGELVVSSSPGTGTAIEVRMPVNPPS